VLETVGVRGSSPVPPGKSPPHQLLVQHPVAHAEFVAGTPILIPPLGDRFHTRPNDRPSDRLSGLRPVWLHAFGRIDAVEVHPNNLPSLAEQMHRVTVQHPMHRSYKRLTGGRNRNAEEQPDQDNRKAYLPG
jgi:hypothetical protein